MFGGPHAEVNAVNAIKDPSLLSQATVYVTLEPCTHFGKTPPCADLLVKHQVKKVVIAATDSNPLVGGKGIEKLKLADIEVELGVLNDEARSLNRRFFTQIERNRPYVILKWAETQDGFIARKDFDSKWISNPQARQLVHKWRAEEDAIMVGTRTAQHDNPKLNVRDWKGKNPLRIVIDKYLKLEPQLSLFDQTQPTICYNLIKTSQKENLDYVKLEEGELIPQILADLHKRKVQSVIIEGGAVLLQKFINDELWDEARVFTGQSTFKEGIASPRLNIAPSEQVDILGDTLNIIINKSWQNHFIYQIQSAKLKNTRHYFHKSKA